MFSVSESGAQRVYNYIANQRQHRKDTFQHELRTLLEKTQFPMTNGTFGIEFDTTDGHRPWMDARGWMPVDDRVFPRAMPVGDRGSPWGWKRPTLGRRAVYLSHGHRPGGWDLTPHHPAHPYSRKDRIANRRGNRRNGRLPCACRWDILAVMRMVSIGGMSPNGAR